MPYQIEYDQPTGCIRIKVIGELDLALLKAMAQEAGNLAQQYECKRILNDLRLAQPTTSTLEIYTMPKTAEQSGVNIRCKRALVVGDRKEAFNFLETAFVLQGHSVRMFLTTEEAEAWLFSDQK